MPTEKSKARRVVDIETPDTAITAIPGVLFSVVGGYNRRGEAFITCPYLSFCYSIFYLREALSAFSCAVGLMP